MQSSFLLSSLFLALSALPAQVDLIIPVGRVAVPPAGSYPLTRFVDLNRDGVFDTAAELSAFQKKFFSLASNNCFIMDLAVIVEGGRLAFYMTDSGNSTLGECFLIRSVDENGNGSIEDSETRVWVD